MLSLSSPLWLLGLALLPLVRWLHRFQDTQHSLAVPALFLWRGQLQSQAVGIRPDRPDPRWRLRALLVALLLLAMSGPHWNTTTGRAIHVWVDDSLSMFSVEEGQSRLHTGLQRLVETLQTTAPAAVALHSLGNPGLHLQLEMSDADDRLATLLAWARTPRGRPQPPAAVHMEAQAEHWLISDGADQGIQKWLSEVALHGVIQVGTSTENAAITRLAARPALGRNTPGTGMISVHNLGQQHQQRTLILESDIGVLQQWDLSLAAGASLTREFALIEAAGTKLHARLSPQDALARDDALHLDISRLAPIQVRLQGRCGRHLHNALRTHPRLSLHSQDSTAYELSIACAAQSGNTTGPTIYIHTPRNPQPVTASASWNTDTHTTRWPRLDPAWLYSEAPGPPDDAQRVLLGTAQQPLIALHNATPRFIDVYLDLENEVLVRQPEYPALIDALVGHALQRRPLEETVGHARDATQSSITPQPLQPIEAMTQRQAVTGDSHPLSAYLILFGVLLLLVDLMRTRTALAQTTVSDVKPA